MEVNVELYKYNRSLNMVNETIVVKKDCGTTDEKVSTVFIIPTCINQCRFYNYC